METGQLKHATSNSEALLITMNTNQQFPSNATSITGTMTNGIEIFIPSICRLYEYIYHNAFLVGELYRPISSMISNSEKNPTAGNLNALHADGPTTTTDVLKVTVNKLVQRGENLDALDNRTDDFYSTLHRFRGTTRPVNRDKSSCCGRVHYLYRINGRSPMEEMSESSSFL
ncbi:unnamed protein product [Adineta ricciae]|uniref:Uncharacterized protein n=1 Tax=Adineta ricciae TaxID=249248 RepID=A0A813ZME4_ADIRI|nr:unnamed protein product [Adineta ricciae]